MLMFPADRVVLYHPTVLYCAVLILMYPADRVVLGGGGPHRAGGLGAAHQETRQPLQPPGDPPHRAPRQL